jgi:hypothetical protein
MRSSGIHQGRRAFGLAGATVVLSCGGQAPEQADVGATEQPFVFAPVQGPSTAGDLPPLPNGPGNTASGAFIQGNQLSPTPAEMAEPWLFETVGDQFCVAPNFPQRMLEAAFLTGAGLNEYWSDNLFLDEILEWLDPSSPPLGGPPVPKTFGYKPERARWLAAQRTSSGLTDFVDPPKFQELRFRGLRLYCAARTAQAANPQTTVMGKRSLASLNIFGKRIDFLSLEPTVSMAAPQKLDSGTNDGAQAFVIPMAGGVRVTPISLFRSLPELRAPVLMLTADSEVRSRSNLSGSNFKEWHTVSHIDGFASGNQTVARKESPKIVLVTLGPIPIYGKFSIDLEIASCSQATSMSTCKSSSLRPVTRVLHGTQFGGVVAPMPAPWASGRAAGFGFTTSGTPTAGTRDEASWIVNFDNGTVRRNGSSPWIWGPPSNSPMMTRMLQDNDKSMELRTGVTLGTELSTGATFDQFPLLISGSVSGTISASAAVVHSFREQQEIILRRLADDEFNQLFPDPVTDLTVTPATEGALRFASTASVTIGIRGIPFIGTLSKTIRLWSVSTESTTTPSRWPESNRLRIETARELAGSFNTGEQSHWPRQGSFASYPPEGLLGCLTSSLPFGELPPICKSKAPVAPPGGSTTPPAGDMCVYLPTGQDPDWSGAEFQCFGALQSYVRRVTTWRQTFQGQTVDAHPIGWNSSTDRNALQAAIITCANGFGAENSATVGSRLQSWVRTAACDAPARRLFVDASATIVTLPDSPALTPSSCQ